MMRKSNLTTETRRHGVTRRKAKSRFTENTGTEEDHGEKPEDPEKRLEKSHRKPRRILKVSSAEDAEELKKIAARLGRDESLHQRRKEKSAHRGEGASLILHGTLLQFSV